MERDNRLGLPDQKTDIAQALLVLLYQRGEPVRPKKTMAPLANFYRLSDEQQYAMRPEQTKGPEWDSYVSLARLHLADQGLIDRSVWGKWRLTPAGAAKAEQLARSPRFAGVRFV